MNKHMRKFVTISLAVMMGTFGFLENSSQKVIADVVESTVESVETAINETTEDVTTTDEQTSKIVNETTESVNVGTHKKTVETKNDNDVTKTKEESNVSDKDKKSVLHCIHQEQLTFIELQTEILYLVVNLSFSE